MKNSFIGVIAAVLVLNVVPLGSSASAQLIQNWSGRAPSISTEQLARVVHQPVVSGGVTYQFRPVGWAKVELLRENGSIFATTYTRPDGSYMFYAAPAGQHLSVRASHQGRNGILARCAYFSPGRVYSYGAKGRNVSLR